MNFAAPRSDKRKQLNAGTHLWRSAGLLAGLLFTVLVVAVAGDPVVAGVAVFFVAVQALTVLAVWLHAAVMLVAARRR